MAPFIDVLDRALREPIRVVVSMPPRHAKTETLLHWLALTLYYEPDKQVSYVGYSTEFAHNKSRKVRGIAERCGVPFAPDQNAKGNWRTGIADGGLWATGIGGPLTGEGFHCLVLDDPVKDRATAESAREREKVYEWFNDTAFTRIEPNGSCIVVMTRWHEDDLAGRLVKDGFTYLRLPAIDDAGQSLWPKRWPPKALLRIKEQLGDYGWSSLYQGLPRPRGGSLFQDAHYYEQFPTWGLRWVIGIDFAYTKKTHADYSVAVVMAESAGIYYVAEVVRLQTQAPIFAETLKALKAKYQAARLHAYVGGTEKGVVDLLNSTHGLNINPMPAVADKFVRAQGTSAKWNQGRILIPSKPKWVNPFVEEVCGFTGVNDANDDQVDALVSAYDAFARMPAPYASQQDVLASVPAPRAFR